VDTYPSRSARLSAAHERWHERRNFDVREAVEALTRSIGGISGFSPAGLLGEVLLRALLVEFRRDLQQRGSSAKTTLVSVASGFGLEICRSA
jgi:hypothetical protein